MLKFKVLNGHQKYEIGKITMFQETSKNLKVFLREQIF